MAQPLRGAERARPNHRGQNLCSEGVGGMPGVGRCLDWCCGPWLTLARQPFPTSLHQRPGPGSPRQLGP